MLWLWHWPSSYTSEWTPFKSLSTNARQASRAFSDVVNPTKNPNPRIRPTWLRSCLYRLVEPLIIKPIKMTQLSVILNNAFLCLLKFLNLFLPKLPCTRLQSVIEMMFVSCMCLFSLPLVPVPAEVPSGTSPSQRGICNAMSAGIQLSLQVTRCQLKNQRLYKALPPPHQRKSARFLSVTEQRKLTWRISKRHIYFMTIKTIYSRNKMNINVVLGLS